jgi:hypothetical protein
VEVRGAVVVVVIMVGGGGIFVPCVNADNEYGLQFLVFAFRRIRQTKRARGFCDLIQQLTIRGSTLAIGLENGGHV